VTTGREALTIHPPAHQESTPMTRTITLTGARGGQGTSTVAAALAVLCAGHAPTILCSDDPTATAALVGVPVPLGDGWIDVCPNLTLVPNSAGIDGPAEGITVVDAGRTPSGRPVEGHGGGSAGPLRAADGAGPLERYAVLRGPCYVALATLLTATQRFDGVIVVAEPGRSLTGRDVTDVLGIPVVATVGADPSVARTIDAGLLLGRLHRHPEFRQLRRLARRPDPLTIHPPADDTDLPISRGDMGRTEFSCRAGPLRRAVCRAWNRPRNRAHRAERRQALTRGGGLLRR
jgi:hypothetical protein